MLTALRDYVSVCERLQDRIAIQLTALSRGSAPLASAYLSVVSEHRELANEAFSLWAGLAQNTGQLQTLSQSAHSTPVKPKRPSRRNAYT